MPAPAASAAAAASTAAHRRYRRDYEPLTMDARDNSQSRGRCCSPQPPEIEDATMGTRTTTTSTTGWLSTRWRTMPTTTGTTGLPSTSSSSVMRRTTDTDRRRWRTRRRSSSSDGCGWLDDATTRTMTTSRRRTRGTTRTETTTRRWTGTRRRLAGLAALLIVCLMAGGPARCAAQSHQCAVGLKTPGRTWPAGDIVLEHGSPLRILCILNKSFIETSFAGKNSSDLVFFKGQRQIEPEYVTVLNETAIRLDIDLPQPENAMYYCKLRLDESYDKDYEAVCLNKVVVGFKPQEPRSFDCVSRNWENMTCSWDPPPNYVDTTYSITFKLPGRAGGRQRFPCPADNEDSSSSSSHQAGRGEKPRNACFWDTRTNPLYRQPYEYYTFNLTGENALGNWSGVYKFHHFGHVIPAPPTNLTVKNKTLETATLHWMVPFPMQTFPPGLHHRVAHQNQWDGKDTWQLINITNDAHNPNRYYTLRGLKYANAIYDVRVFMKSAVAVGEDKWSNYSDITFRTPPRVPGLSPRTDVGSFEISENNVNRDVYLYWQTIPPYEENGNGFRYQVYQVQENGRRVFVSPNETTRSYAKFRGLGHQSSYRFEIVASNEVGNCEIPARIYVPSRSAIPKEPVAFTKIAFDDGLYELSWKPPIGGDDDILNYTIFWCENDRDRPYQCTGYLEWIHVGKNSMLHNITVPNPQKVYQFAIAANTERASSGMMWASCTVIHNKVVGKMKTVWINRIGSTVIEVGWKLDCSDRIGIVEGFKIYYCPIVSPYNLNCKEPKQNTTIKADLNTIRGEVEGLKPYTTYMIAVAVLTKNGEGQHSDPLYNTTLESPPSEPPRDVVVRNVTNTTMHLEWKKPDAMNGVLRYYVVYYNDLSKKVEEVPRVELRGLGANQNYSVKVAACTVDCSAKSEPVYVVTDIGVPNRIMVPNVRFVNSSQVKVLWSKPSLPAGPLNYYQIKSNDGEIQNTTHQEALLSIPDCKTDGSEKLYRFQVRAVNIAPNNEHLFGNWSDAGEGNCFSNGPSYRVWIVIWVIGSICGIAFVFCVAYSSKRIWLKCKAMQDVEVKLPPGLAPNMKLLQKTSDQHTRQSSADSSGCSSGQESVTSSLTSDSQVSNDSGADVDPGMSKKLIIDGTAKSTSASSPAWESSSLRQRNVGGASKPNLEATTRWDPYVKIAKGSNELIMPSAPPVDALSLARSTPNLSDNLGFTASQQTWSSTGYISMPSSEEMSSNPSPVPKENPNTGCYSVVGLMPKSPLRCKSEEETSSLAKVKTETETKPAANPYVSLVSLEQKSKENTKRTLDSLRVFDDLGFDKPKQQPQSQSDKLSRPYVQSGFLETKKAPAAAAATFDPRHKPSGQQQQQQFFGQQSSLADDLASKLTPVVAKHQQQQQSDSKPYVTVASIAEVTARKPVAATQGDVQRQPHQQPQQQQSTTAATFKPYIPVSALMGTDAKTMFPTNQPVAKPTSLAASTTVNMEEPEKVGLYPSLDLDDAKDEPTLSVGDCAPSSGTSPAAFTTLCWQPIDPTADGRSQSPATTEPANAAAITAPSPMTVKSASGYVTLLDASPQPPPAPAAKFGALRAASAKPHQTAQPSADEQQYSKVAVVPRTLH